jgi:hypothetical protein
MNRRFFQGERERERERARRKEKVRKQEARKEELIRLNKGLDTKLEMN